MNARFISQSDIRGYGSNVCFEPKADARALHTIFWLEPANAQPATYPNSKRQKAGQSIIKSTFLSARQAKSGLEKE